MSQVTPLQDDSSHRSGWRWFPLNVGTALALAVVVSLLAFMLTSNGEPSVAAAANADLEQLDDQTDEVARLAEPAPASNSTDGGTAVVEDGPGVESAPPTTVAATAVRADGGGDAALSSSFSVLAMAGDITNMGSTEVGFVTNFPLVEYVWERIELPAGGGADIGWLGELNGKLVAVGPSWSNEYDGTGQSLVAVVSADGMSWDVAGSYELPDDAWVSRVVSDGEQVFAFAEHWVEESGASEHFLYSSSDGVDWAVVDLDLAPEPDEYVYIQTAAAGSAGLALAVSFESSPEEQPALLEFDSLQVELDHMRGTYSLIDAETGEVIVSGALDDIFNWGGEGQSIYDPETAELLTTIPWEVWERAYTSFYNGGYPGGSPLPIPVYTEQPPTAGVITVEYDGLVVTIDEYGDSYVVTDVAGEEIATGTMEYLYQGPPPRFVDESGEVLLSVTWDEWYRAEEQSYMHLESSYYEYRSRTELLTSADGVTWAAESVPNRNGANVSYLIATDDGFVAMVNSYGEFGDHRSVWTYSGGAWSSVVTEHSDLWLYQLATTQEGLLGVGEGPGGPALWSSVDGIAWTSEFAIVPQDDGSYVSLAGVAADESGTVGVVARKEKWSDYQPLVIEQDGYTLTFEDGETVLRVTDNSGGVVLSLGWESFEVDGGSDAVTWDNGTTYINLDNGVVIAIADEDAYAAMDSRWTDQGKTGLSVFIKDGGQWAESIVDVDGGLGGASQLHMVDGRIIIGGTYWENVEPYRSDLPSGGSFVILVGTPIGG